PPAAVAQSPTPIVSSKICDFVQDENVRKTKCEPCFALGNSWTAIGCIPTDPAGFIGTFLGFGVGIAGGIAFLLILFGGFQIMTSSGNPERLNAGRELVGAAITGLLLIVFSLFLLRLIGFNILGIPLFG
ncbi:MAG: hypothetical protein ACOY0S_03155, partial [Patescibacteria group bacterium]